MGISRQPLNKGDYIGITAFAGVVLGAFSTFSFSSRISGTETQLLMTFFLGGLFAVLGILSNRIVDYGSKFQSTTYFVVQAAIGLTCIWISPAKGFFGILCLPLASQTIFMFRGSVALACGLFLFVATAFVFYPLSGWSGFWQGMAAYSTGYIFTIGFTFVTHDAVVARIKASELATELETANAQLRAHAEQAEEVATIRERNRLAREIHDGVGHYLTVINVQVDAARTLINSEPDQATEALGTAARLSREALEDVRRSVGSLRAEAARKPLIDSLNALIDDASLPVNFEVVGTPRTLSSATEHALFRAAQEGLTNISKHAAAAQSWVSLNFGSDQRTRLTVEDDGKGPAPQHSGGFGLKGMHERIELLGGKVTSGPREGGGFSLSVEVPS